MESCYIVAVICVPGIICSRFLIAFGMCSLTTSEQRLFDGFKPPTDGEPTVSLRIIPLEQESIGMMSMRCRLKLDLRVLSFTLENDYYVCHPCKIHTRKNKLEWLSHMKGEHSPAFNGLLNRQRQERRQQRQNRENPVIHRSGDIAAANTNVCIDFLRFVKSPLPRFLPIISALSHSRSFQLPSSKHY